MKTFAQYLAESAQVHRYRIKFAGDVPADFLRKFKQQLQKFEPEQIGDVKTTPVMSTLADFPGFNNESVSMMDVTFRYPATPPQVSEMVKLLGLDPNRFCMVQRDYAEGMDTELLGIEQQKDVLTTPYPENTKEQRDLKKDYAAVGEDKQVVKNSAQDATWTVAGGKTPPAKTTNDLPMGVTSPMSTVKRPPRPETGFRK